MGLFSRKPKAAATSPSVNADNVTASAGSAAPAAPFVPPTTPDSPASLVNNTLVQEAVEEGWAKEQNYVTMFRVLRQCTTGELLLDITASTIADPSKGFQQGDTLAVGQVVDVAGKRLLLAFTSNERLAQYLAGAAPVSLGQPTTAVLKQAMTEYEGIAIDAGSPETMFIAHSEEIARALTPDPAVNEPLKTALVLQKPFPELLSLAAAAEVIFIATKEERDEAGEIARIFVPHVIDPTGERFTPAFTSPAEVWAWDTELNARPTRFANIVRASLEDGHNGVVINPGGVSPRIPSADLQPFAQ
jgi:hypothetical protein